MGDLIPGVIIGFIGAVVVMSLLWYFATKKMRADHQREQASHDEALVDLRQERAEDKETNRRLRHELAANTPDQLVEAANQAKIERDGALTERDQTLEQLELVRSDLAAANGRLLDREAKLRQYRKALQEIRISLETQDRTRSLAADGLIDTDTGEVPSDALLGTESAEAAGD